MVPQGSSPSNPDLPQTVHVVRGRARAEAVAPVAAALQELLGHDVAAWRDRGFDVVKERTVRTVLQGMLGGVPVHIKVFRTDTLSDRARDALRGPRGAREQRNLLRARALDLPTVEPLACGMAGDGDQLRSFLITRSVAPAAPFHFGMPGHVQQQVGSLLRRMHDAGVLPGDLHPGNLLVDAAEAPWLLDLSSVRHGGEASLSQRAAALALFCHQLDGGPLDPRARRLLDGYRTEGAELPAKLTRELMFAARRWRASALPAFGRRCTRTCRHTEVPERRRGEPRWYLHLGAGVVAARGATDELRSSCAQIAQQPPPPTKTGRRGGVWVLDTVVMKEREAGAAKKLWRAAYWLLFAGVATPPPIALRTFRSRGAVFSQRLANDSLATELAAGRLAPAAIDAAAQSLGRNVGRLHAHGLRNRDLKFDNLVRNPHTGEVAMVDLDGVARQSATDTRGAGADLGRLLAAFRAAGAPGGNATVRTFLRSWLRAHRTLLQQPPLRRLLRTAEHRAGEWAAAHRHERTAAR